MKALLVSLLALVLITACSQSESKKKMTLNEQVNALISEAKFEEAMSLLDDEPSSPEISKLKENVHLKHGIHLIYNSEPSQMKENANQALREFIAVLEINPNNEKAKAETEQILGIYRSFPNRAPAQDVLDKLKELGFNV